MPAPIRQLLAAAALVLAAGHCAAQAGAAAAGAASAVDAAGLPAAEVAKGPPAGFVAPADPRGDDSNALRGKSQPGNNAPFWRAVRDSGNNAGVTNLPGAEKGVLIQPFVQYPGSRLTNAGEAWRQVRNQWLIPYGGALLLIVLLGFALFYWRKGPLGEEHADTGRRVERFTPFERAAHWSNAGAFVTLAVSGIVMAYGKFFLLPVLGGTLFGGLAYGLKFAHNFAGPLFAVSLPIVFFTFVKDNLPSKADLVWLVKGGGLLLGEHQLPSGRFNAAEKIIFWTGVFALGAVVVASGLVLDKLVPGLDYLRGDLQIAHLVHGCATALMLALFTGHIYLGTVGTRGAYRGMREGWVDEAWAREHHSLWLDDIHAGRIPAQRSKPPGGHPVGPTAPQA